MVRSRKLAQSIALLLVFALPGRSAESYALPRTLMGTPEDASVSVERLPANISLNQVVRLQASGRVLLVSNSPEYLADGTPLLGALYRDEVVGQFRIFYHHANNGSNDVTVATAVTNLSDVPVTLFKEGFGQGDNRYSDVAGQHALCRYLASRTRVRQVAFLPPGASVVVAP